MASGLSPVWSVFQLCVPTPYSVRVGTEYSVVYSLTHDPRTTWRCEGCASSEILPWWPANGTTLSRLKPRRLGQVTSQDLVLGLWLWPTSLHSELPIRSTKEAFQVKHGNFSDLEPSCLVWVRRNEGTLQCCTEYNVTKDLATTETALG